VYQAVLALQTYVDRSGLDAKLRELNKIRASQINGCAYCLAMHTREARKLGETEERMHLLDAWREAPI
jgi:AhpD family alkylhydroperoxidase